MKKEKNDTKRFVTFWLAFVIVAIILLVIIVLLTNRSKATNEVSDGTVTEEVQEYAETDAFKEMNPETIPGFIPVPGYENLVYSEETQTVYHLTFIQEGAGKYATSYTIMAPYIDNGHYYECQNGELVEIVP